MSEVDDLVKKRSVLITDGLRLELAIAERKGRGEAVVDLRAEKMRIESLLADIRRRLQTIAKEEAAIKLAAAQVGADLVAELTLFQCLRKAAALLCRRNDAESHAVAELLRRYLAANPPRDDDGRLEGAIQRVKAEIQIAYRSQL